MSQRTHVCHVQKDSVSDALRLLDLGGLAVDWIESDTFGGRVVHLVTADVPASQEEMFRVLQGMHLPEDRLTITLRRA